MLITAPTKANQMSQFKVLSLEVVTFSGMGSAYNGGYGGARTLMLMLPSPFWPMSLAALFALPTNLNINKFSHSAISDSLTAMKTLRTSFSADNLCI